jgi:hypothetical protein
MKTKRGSSKRPTISREETIKQLNKDLAKLMPDFTPDIPIDLYSGNKVRIKDLSPTYQHPNRRQQMATLPQGEYKLLGKHENLLNILHNNESHWIPLENTEVTLSDLATGIEAKASDWRQKGWQKLMQKAAEIRDKYEGNPYIRIAGFSIDITWPPGLSIDFEFKDVKP